MTPHRPIEDWIDRCLRGLQVLKTSHFPSDEEKLVLPRDFAAEAYERGVELDVAIEVDGEEVKGSKFILMACSDVFRLMLDNDKWKESQDNRIKFDDMGFKMNAVKEVVKWMHSYHTSVIKFATVQDAVDVYHVAHYLQVDLVKDMALRVLMENVCKENVAAVITLAHLYDLEPLFELCVRKVSDNNWPTNNLPDWDKVAADSRLLHKFFESYCVLTASFVAELPVSPPVFPFSRD